MIDNYKIYSVESRKGGVGKTTMALFLAKQLIAKGPVLLLDCDVTGTSISIPAEKSSFWNKQTNVIHTTNSSEKDGSEKMCSNLLDVFTQKYLRGIDCIADLINKETVKEDRINIIGSEIFDNQYKPIVDTRLLMDEIHSRWLVEFVTKLSESFAGIYEKSTVSIIIDNSPGYVGFNVALHRKMAKLGPERSKFLFVSTYDEQDLRSCLAAVKEIKNTFSDYSKVGTYVRSLREGGGIDKDLEKLLKDNHDLNALFYELVEQKDVVVPQNKDDNFCSLIINKVPAGDEDFTYPYADILADETTALLLDVTCANDSDTPNTIIKYNPNFEFQFYTNAISQSLIVDKDFWNEKFNNLEFALEAVPNGDERNITYTKIVEIYESLLKLLADNKYKTFLRKLPFEWKPKYVVDQFNLYIGSLGTFDTRVDYTLANFPKEDVYNHMMKKLRDGLSEGNPYIDSVVTAFYIAAKKLGYQNNSYKCQRLCTLSILSSAFITKYRLSLAAGIDFIEYLKQEMKSEGKVFDWQKHIGDDIDILEDYSIKTTDCKTLQDSAFPVFCNRMSGMILRLITMKADVRSVIKLCRMFVPFTDARYITKEIKDYMNSYIVDKTLDFNEEKLTDMRFKITQMKEMEMVFQDYILKKWNHEV